MNLPFFYTENIEPATGTIVLDEDNSRHVVSVLRMEAGEQLHLADGKGNLVTASIADPHKKKCRLSVTGTQFIVPPARKTAIGISLVKNPVRFEWFLEKATEIGITSIFPILCHRTEKQHFRYDRMKNVLVSAMLQSRQAWLPILHEPVKFDSVMVQADYQQKFIAHCIEADKKNLGGSLINPSANQLILIGPEGDFTADEIEIAIQYDFIPVALGATRLRTETAGMVAAVLLKNVD
ncbi:MAG: RsmE family RNA methyltransferase [Chitinophagaceae bacterium]